jgi:hypothetical protein
MFSQARPHLAKCACILRLERMRGSRAQLGVRHAEASHLPGRQPSPVSLWQFRAGHSPGQWETRQVLVKFRSHPAGATAAPPGYSRTKRERPLSDPADLPGALLEV